MRAAESSLQALQAHLESAIESEKSATKAQINSVLEISRLATSGGGQGAALAAAALEYEFETVDGLAKRGVDASIVADLKRRYDASSSYEYEPLADFGPKLNAEKGQQFEASVAPVGGSFSVFEVTLRVKGTEPAKPLSGDVAFLFHHTLPPQVRIVGARNGIAEIKVQCVGTFVAGAIVLADQTRLAFDLSTLPSVPTEFLDG
jgi:hypothetical protein